MTNPSWLETAVFYEIYPQSFQDSNGDGIGDLPGVISRLPYIKELGCNAIWLNPCFQSPFFDAGYDISDYKTVAPRYGTNQDLKDLFDKAHAMGMHVILDLVPGHTSIQHPWFQESMQAQSNAYSQRYIWTDDVWEDVNGVENLTGFIRGFSDRNGCCAVNFYSIQPALNYGFAHPTKPWMCAVDSEAAIATREAIKDVMRFWLDLGCDGFRVDMAGSLIKGDTDGSATVALWQDFRAFLDQDYPEAVMISEWGQPDKSLRGGFHMDFLLHFGPSHYMDLFRVDEPYFSRRGAGSAKAFVETYQSNYRATNGAGLICIPSGNHDMARMRGTLDPEEMKLAFLFLLTMPGVPFIYYGDEIGMRNLDGLPSVEGGFERTAARSPMQWDHSANAGFSSASPEKLYIPIDPDPNRPTVADAIADNTSIYAVVKTLLAIRKQHSAFSSSSHIQFLSDGDLLAYRRSGEDEQVLVLLNPADRQTVETLPENWNLELLYYHRSAPHIQGTVIEMPPESGAIYQIR